MKTLLITATLAFVACRAQPTEEEYDDVATGVGALVSENNGGEGESFQDATNVSRGLTATGFSSSGEGAFHGRRGALEYSWSYTCKDNTGTRMTICGATTDTANFTLHFQGEAAIGTWQGSLERNGDWTITDLTTPIAKLNGTGSFHADSSFTAIYRDVARSFVFDYRADYTNVEINTETLELQGGAIHYEIHAERTKERGAREVTRKLDISADVEFSHNAAELILDGERRYAINLQSGAVTRAYLESRPR